MPCTINSISKSKPGKHGSAKARVEVVGVFDGQKRTFPALHALSDRATEVLYNALAEKIHDIEYEVEHGEREDYTVADVPAE